MNCQLLGYGPRRCFCKDGNRTGPIRGGMNARGADLRCPVCQPRQPIHWHSCRTGIPCQLWLYPCGNCPGMRPSPGCSAVMIRPHRMTARLGPINRMAPCSDRFRFDGDRRKFSALDRFAMRSRNLGHRLRARLGIRCRKHFLAAVLGRREGRRAFALHLHWLRHQQLRSGLGPGVLVPRRLGLQDITKGIGLPGHLFCVSGRQFGPGRGHRMGLNGNHRVLRALFRQPFYAREAYPIFTDRLP